MAFDFGTMSANLAVATGDDHVLLAELRRDYAQSAARQLDLLRRARCDGNWQVAARRLRELGASFHDSELMDLAEQALSYAPGEPMVLRAIDEHIAEIGGNTPG